VAVFLKSVFDFIFFAGLCCCRFMFWLNVTVNGCFFGVFGLLIARVTRRGTRGLCKPKMGDEVS
jgi:hypothetical protein